MNKVQKDTDSYIVYSPDSLKYITDKMYDVLDNSISFYKKLFDIEKFRKVQINYFDNIDDFRNFIYNLRGEDESLPSYAKGTFDKGMINAFIEVDIKDEVLYNRKLCMASHELFHIMYQELILNEKNIDRVVWFDEGMAQLFSSEYDYFLSLENFDSWFKQLIRRTKKIPNLNEINHGMLFETDEYSLYDLSLLAVKYLYETLSFLEFKSLMSDSKKIREYGDFVLNEAIKYYNKVCFDN